MDVVRLYDGNSESDPLLGEFSGNTIPISLVSTGNEVLVTFSSNSSIREEGWFLTYHAETPTWCTGMQTLTTQSGNISDGSYNFNYHNNSTCMWNIEPVSGGSVVLLFNDFDTEENKDFVKVYDAETSQLLGEFSGTYEPENLPEPIISPSGKMFVTFSSNATVTRAGWSADYTLELSSNENPELANISIFPNPAKDKVSININEIKTNEVEIVLESISGQVVFKQGYSTTNRKLKTTINTKEIPVGIYLISILTKDQYVRKKLIIVE